MKKFTFIPFLLLALLAFSFTLTAQTFSGGDGTVANPYQISTKAELLEVKNYADKAFVLLNDIDFNGDSPYSTSIVGNFSGKFDGLGYRILNLTLEGSISFFGSITETGIVKNLHIRDLIFTQYFYSNGSTNSKNQYHAAFAYTNNGEIENCSYEGVVTAYAYLAGFVLTNNGTIKNCYSNAIINAYDGQNISNNWYPGRYAGGFVRLNNASGTIINCYSAGTVTVGDRGTAGFIHTNAGQINNSFAFNTSILSTWYGSAVHRFADSNTGTLTDVYALENMTLNGSTITSSDASSIEGADISSGDIPVQTTYTNQGWDFERNWQLEADDTYPQLRVLPDCPTITLTEITSSACENSTFNESISASGGEGTYEFALSAGTLPSEISLSTAGVLSGTLTTPGTFNFTVSATDENGCMGTRDYSFTVFPTETSSVSETICFGSSYIFGLQTLTQSGIYTETFQTVNGCDSVVTLNLTVNPVYNHTETVNVCEGESYNFGGIVYTESGEYTHTFTTVNGCDSVVTLDLTVNPVYNVMHSGEDAVPDFLVNETFEETPLNSFPDDWIIRYAGTGTNNHYVVNAPVKNGNHSLKVSGSGWAANLSKPVADIPDNVMLEGWIRAENVASGGRCGLGIGNPDVGSWGAYWGRVEFYKGNLITFYYTGNSGGYGTQYVLQPASSDTWYHVKIETDAAAGTYKVYINGEQASSETGGQTTAEFPLYTSISATSVEIYGNSLVYFDDIRMYESGNSSVTICASELPYNFGGDELTESGIYTKTFETIHGCDSVVTLNLIVNPVYNHTETATICEGENYDFGGTVYTESGEYTHTFTSINGCDSTVVLTLTVNPVYSHTDAHAICEGETYIFGTRNLTTSGEYTEVFESVNGCDSTVVLTLKVNPVYHHTDTQAICEGETYVFGTQNLTTSGEYTEVFESIHGCDSTVDLTLTVNPVYNIYETVTVFENELPYQFGEQSLTTGGEYVEAFISISGCDSIVTLTLVVNTKDNIPPEIVCNPIEVSLNSSGNYEFDEEDILALTEGTTDNFNAYDELLIEVEPGSFSCEDAGNEIPVIVTVTDLNGNVNSCSTTVNVLDQTSPLIFLKNLSISLDENGEARPGTNDFYYRAYDACGISSITVSQQEFDCSHIGSNNVGITVVDNHNNKRYYTSTVTVFDEIPPVIQFVEDQTIEVDEGKCYATIDYPELITSDNCDVADLFLIEGLGPDGEFPVGTNLERWVAVDSSGNSDTLSFEITVLMSYEDPSINPISDVEVLQGTEMVSVQLSGIFGGAVCETLPLEFALEFSSEELVDSYSFEYELGDETGSLKLTLADNVYGESLITLKVVGIETGKAYYTEFILFVSKVNHPPYLVQHPENLEMNAGDTLSVILSSEKGELFDDNDEEDSLSLSLRVENGSTLPEWLMFRNDSLIAYPAISDTGCYNLLLVATDLDGEEAFSSFTLCVSFSSGIQVLEFLEVKVYPNPTSGRVYVDFSEYTGHKAEILVTDILGKVVLRNTLYVEERLEIDLSDRVTGIYFLKIILNGDEVNRKLILVRDH